MGLYEAPSYTGEEEQLLDRVMETRGGRLTLWDDFNRSPKHTEYEQNICVIKGKERFRVVSPIFRQNILVGAIEGIPQNQCPIDFFDEDVDTSPATKMVNFLDTTLGPGDCMYVPAYFYIQSMSLGDENYVDNKGQTMIITHLYESHSRLIDMIFNGIEDNRWDAKSDKVYLETLFDQYLGNIIP